MRAKERATDVRDHDRAHRASNASRSTARAAPTLSARAKSVAARVSRAGALMRRSWRFPESSAWARSRRRAADFAADTAGLEAARRPPLRHGPRSPAIGLVARSPPLFAAHSGAYFTHEYRSSRRLCNPSLVARPTSRTWARRAALRDEPARGRRGPPFVDRVSLRLSDQAATRFEPPGPVLVGGQRTPAEQLREGLSSGQARRARRANELSAGVLARLRRSLHAQELEASLVWLEEHGPPPAIWFETSKIIRVLAAVELRHDLSARLVVAERVLFPAGPTKRVAWRTRASCASRR